MQPNQLAAGGGKWRVSAGLEEKSVSRNGMVWYSTQWYSGSVRGWNASLVSGARNWQTIKAVKKCSQQQIGKAIAREKCRGAKWQEGCCKRKNSLKSWLFSWSWSIKNVSYTQQRKKKKERKKKNSSKPKQRRRKKKHKKVERRLEL